jgi:hypothetical protein
LMVDEIESIECLCSHVEYFVKMNHTLLPHLERTS